jgi:5-methyltetrahydropteroyltriglutamate--homocysteine methyltransferase
MRRSTDRILTTHTGALHRPRDLEELLKARLEGKAYDERALDARLRTAVNEIVQKQFEVGVDIVDDGEFSKPSWTTYATERLSGIDFVDRTAAAPAVPGKDATAFAEFYAQYGRVWPHEPWEIAEGRSWRGTPVVTGPLKYSGREQIQRDIDNLAVALAENGIEEGFLPVVAPGSLQPGLANEYYSDDESYFAALSDALREEYLAIADSGLILQVDDAYLPYLYDLRREWSFEQFRDWANLAVEALRAALEGIPEEQVRYHVCWGSWNGPHSADLPLRDIVDLILRVPAQAYNIESANPRHAHEWTVWRDVKLPDGKILIPGVVEHATNILDHPETVAQRIIRFAEIVGRENVIAGTDCGHRGRVPRSLVWAKQQAITDGAAIATRALWPNKGT